MRIFKRFPTLAYPNSMADKITLPEEYDKRYSCKVTYPAESVLVESFIEKGYTFNAGRYRSYAPEDDMTSFKMRMLVNFILAIHGEDPLFFRFISSTQNAFHSLESVIAYYSPVMRNDLLNEVYPAEDYLMQQLQQYMKQRYPEFIEVPPRSPNRSPLKVFRG